MPRRKGNAAERRFRLATDPRREDPVLTEEDTQHALRVLRLTAGDRALGLDGCGRAWPLEVLRADRRALEVRLAGEPATAPAPGSPGGGPRVEVYAPIPRQGEAETMADQLTQAGAAAWVLLETSRSRTRQAGAARPDRLKRAAQEATKQCLRLWDLELTGPLGLSEALEAARASGSGVDWVLDAEGSQALGAAIPSSAPPTSAGPIRLWVGPEGGWAPEDLEALESLGGQRAFLGPHVLRTSLAAVLATGVILAGEPRSAASQADPAG